MAGQLSKTTSENAKTEVKTNNATGKSAEAVTNYGTSRSYEKVMEKVTVGDSLKAKIRATTTESKSKTIEVIPLKDKDKVLVKETVVTEIAETIRIYGKIGSILGIDKERIEHYSRQSEVISKKVITRKEYAEKMAAGDFKKDMGKYIGDSEKRIEGCVKICDDITKAVGCKNWSATLYAKEGTKGKNMGLAGLPKELKGIGSGENGGSFKGYKNGDEVRQDRVVNSGVETLRIAKAYQNAGLNPGIVALTVSATGKPINENMKIEDWSKLADSISKTCVEISKDMSTQEAKELKEASQDMKNMFSTNGEGVVSVAQGREGDFQTLKEAVAVSSIAEVVTPETNAQTLSGESIKVEEINGPAPGTEPKVEEFNTPAPETVDKSFTNSEAADSWARGAAGREPFPSPGTKSNNQILRAAGLYNGMANVSTGFFNKGNTNFATFNIRNPFQAPEATAKCVFEKGIKMFNSDTPGKKVLLISTSDLSHNDSKLSLDDRVHITDNMVSGVSKMMNSYAEAKFDDPKERQEFLNSFSIERNLKME